MSEQPTHWSHHLRVVASVLCDGYLAAQARRREERRAEREEAAVPSSWRVRPPEPPPSADEAPLLVPPPPPPPREPRRPAERPPTPLEPLVLPVPVPPWDIPNLRAAPVSRQSSGPQSARQPNARQPGEAPRPSTAPSPTQPIPPVRTAPKPSPITDPAATPPPQVEPSTSVPVPASPSQTLPPTSDELAQTTEMLGGLVNLLGEVVGDAVSDGLAQAVQTIEQSRALERDNLARTLETALDHQAVQFREALERQAEHFAATMVRQAELQGENMRALLHELLAERSATRDAEPASLDGLSTPQTTEALEELQETLRLGFGEVRAALDRHHRELMGIARAEVRPPVKTAMTPPTPRSTTIPSPAESQPPLLNGPPEEPPDSHLRVTPPPDPADRPTPVRRPALQAVTNAADPVEQAESPGAQDQAALSSRHGVEHDNSMYRAR